MPRRSVLSAAERLSLVAVPTSEPDLHRLYGFSDADLGLIRERRGAANRLGFARFDGIYAVSGNRSKP